MNLYIANPSYSPGYMSGAIQHAALERHPDWSVIMSNQAASLLTFNFNCFWADALNHRQDDKCDYFLMIHADVRPVDNEWLDQLFHEMQQAEADVMSVIIPLKSQEGWTSTAIDTHLWSPRRLCMKEIMQMPITWSDEDLLFNTGLMLVDFRKPWVEKVCFTVNDRIQKRNGKWCADVESEDWNFSRQCRALGVSCFVTRRVKVDHFGMGAYPNYLEWGEQYDGELTRQVA